MKFDLAEAGFVLLLVVGIGLWSVPSALIVAGVLGVVACERVDRKPKGGGDQR